MKIIKKIVASITTFFCGTSAVFLISGAGAPVLRLLVLVIFFVSAINLAPYAKERYDERKKKAAAQQQGGKGGGKPGGGQGGGGGGQGGGGNQGGGQNR